MRKHNGPWKVEIGCKYLDSDTISVVDCNGGQIANDEPYYPYFDSDHAHLIAAAPDMEEALNDLLNHYTNLVNCGDCGNWNPEEEKEVIAARKALTKARGEQE